MYLRIDEHDQLSTAVIEDTGRFYSYGDLCAFSDEFSSWVPARSLIFIFCQNTMGAIAAHVASIENHIVPLMISSHMDQELIDELISGYHPEYLWAPAWMRDSFAEMEVIQEKFEYLLLRTPYSGTEMYDDLAMLLTTSGSTGSPKLVRHSYRNLYANAMNVAGVFGFTPEDRSLIDLQLHYTMGLNVACSSLYAGATLAMTTLNAMDKGYWTFMEEQKVTNLTGVPYSYEILKRLKFFKKDHPHLRILAEGGGKLTDDMFRFVATYAKENGKKFYATFGTSETTARLAFLDPDCALERIGSIGKAIPNGRLSLVDENKEEICTLEATGEMAYQGENVTLGYAYEREDLKKGDERGGIYYTGDLAHRDADGFYYIVGRLSRFLKLYGHRVGLDESERIIKRQFGIECACVGNDKKMHIFVTKEGIDDEIRHYISEKTKILVSSFQVHVVDEIPKNEVGKIMYKALDF